MRMMMIIRIPNETFNAAVRDGTAGAKTKAILEAVKPEAVYFSETHGQRTVVMVVEMDKSSKVPALAEPWFLTFHAAVEFHVVMSPTELQDSGLEKIGEKWG
jgi:hypothetical protein